MAARSEAAVPTSSPERILVVDDQKANVGLLTHMLMAEGYGNVFGATDPRQALPAFVRERPDLILLDLHMPHIGGLELLSRFRALSADEYLPILVLTADDSAQTKLQALQAGATDFLTKPFDHVEVVLRIRHLLEARALHVRLEERVAERTQELEGARRELLERLALAAEYRDDDTHQHTERVGQNAAALARRLGVDDEGAALIAAAAPLHDIGKIGVSDVVLLKPAKLTEEEFEQVKAHTQIGARLLSSSRSDVLQLGEQIAWTHHERWDGTGYPRRLAGEQIPFAGRLVSVIDVFDALTHQRPYKPAWSVQEASAEIDRQAGRAFDPTMAEAYLALVESGEVGVEGC